MYFIRRAAARTLASQPCRQLSTLRRSSTRVSVFQSPQPIAYRAFHQSQLWRIEDESRTSDSIPQGIADEAVAEELKDEAVQAAEVAEAAAETAVNAGEEAPAVAEGATEIATEAAEFAEAAADQAAASFPADELDVGTERAAAAGNVAAAAATTAASAAAAAATAVGGRSSYESAGRFPDSSDRMIYVGNLFFEVNAAQLQAEFEKFGLIESARVATDSRGLSRGFGHVTFQNAEAAQRAIQESNQKVLAGRRMAVQLHRRPERFQQGMRQQRASTPPSKTLFIGNMSYQMSDKDLNDLFRDIKDVLDVRVAIDRRTGQPRGFAHADFVDEGAATRAMEELRDKLVYGRTLKVDYAGTASLSSGEAPARGGGYQRGGGDRRGGGYQRGEGYQQRDGGDRRGGGYQRGGYRPQRSEGGSESEF